MDWVIEMNNHKQGILFIIMAGFCFALTTFFVRLSGNLPTMENIVVTGGMSDVSVMQYALTQKAYFNEIDSKARIIVVENATQTFHTEAHNGNSMHSFAMYNLYQNGVMLARI